MFSLLTGETCKLFQALSSTSLVITRSTESTFGCDNSDVLVAIPAAGIIRVGVLCANVKVEIGIAFQSSWKTSTWGRCDCALCEEYPSHFRTASPCLGSWSHPRGMTRIRSSIVKDCDLIAASKLCEQRCLSAGVSYLSAMPYDIAAGTT